MIFVLAAAVAAALVAIFAIAAITRLQTRHYDQVAELLNLQSTERMKWANERWELNTRIQSPELARMAPPPPPEAQESEVADEVDESHLVGEIAERPEGDA